MGRKLQNGYIESENISVPQMGDQKSPWSTAEKTEQFCGRVLWVSYKNHKTLALPVEQIHSDTQQAESRPLTLPRMHSMLEEPLGEEVPMFEENGFRCCEVHWLYSRCDNPKQHIHGSVSISQLKDTICSVSGTKWQQSQ